MVTNGFSYLDLQQSRPWSLSLQGSDLHQKACLQRSEQLQLVRRRSCNNHRRLILAASPLLCSIISCDRAHIHRNIKTAVYRARKRKRKIKCLQNSKEICSEMNNIVRKLKEISHLKKAGNKLGKYQIRVIIIDHNF